MAKSPNVKPEAADAAYEEMVRMGDLLTALKSRREDLNEEIRKDNQKGKVNWATVGDLKRLNIALIEALHISGDESDTLMYASIALNVKH